MASVVDPTTVENTMHRMLPLRVININIPCVSELTLVGPAVCDGLRSGPTTVENTMQRMLPLRVININIPCVPE